MPGVEDEQLAVARAGDVGLDHIRALIYCDIICQQVVAGDVSAPYAAVRAEDILV